MARILGIGTAIELGAVYLRLMREQHDVRVFADDPSHRGTFGGLIEPVSDWRAELRWVGKDGLILFEETGQGALQDQLRSEGYRVIGGSALGDRLENDRAYGQRILADTGLQTAAYHRFEDPQGAADWLRMHPGRMVLKFDDSARPTFVGEHPEGADVLFMLNREPRGPVLLMQRILGVEVGVGAYFDGARFLRPACIDFEHKRFFPGDVGEMTGEMGTLASYEHAGPLFEATLDRLASVLAGAGHIGYVNLNLIVNEHGIWPLELTCRFGYPGFAVLGALQRDGWADLFEKMLDGRGSRFRVRSGWSVAIVLTIPPFPQHGENGPQEEDPPIFFRSPPTRDEQDSYDLVDVRFADGRLFARKRTGYVMIVTGTGTSVEAAQRTARDRARNVIVPDVRWRHDIGDRFLREDRSRLVQLGWLPECVSECISEA